MNSEPRDTDQAYALLGLADQLIHARALQIAAELGVADLLTEGPRPCGDLAEETGVDPDALHRLLRLLASRGVFQESGPGVFGLTRMGGPLRSDHPATVRSVLVMDSTVAPLIFGGVEHSLRTGEPTFPTVTGEDFYDYLEHHPEEGQVFDRAMDDLTRITAPVVLDAYDLSDTRLVVDVGGGSGTFMSALLRRHPDVTGVVLDTPRVVEVAAERLRAEGLADRCSTVSGDFFEGVPGDGDLYVLKWILHNWSDERAVEILRSCRRAMKPRSRLLAVESMLPEDDSEHPGKSMDLAMLVVSGGRERSERELADLLSRAGLRLERVIPTASPYSLVEAVTA
ncbi:methyltransferase [Nocardiopsis halotolerans]|uniref:methyltransferase n=1 Tax=Nocardiopsis halotolerans TaxID=124252 RepID=UPI000381945F|nr:methyltransferase [Nocardiopsis halotolerans]